MGRNGKKPEPEVESDACDGAGNKPIGSEGEGLQSFGTIGEHCQSKRYEIAYYNGIAAMNIKMLE